MRIKNIRSIITISLVLWALAGSLPAADNPVKKAAPAAPAGPKFGPLMSDAELFANLNLDLPALADWLVDPAGNTLLDLLEESAAACGSDGSMPLLRERVARDATGVAPLAQGARLSRCPAAEIPARMGFIANPTPAHG